MQDSNISKRYYIIDSRLYVMDIYKVLMSNEAELGDIFNRVKITSILILIII